MSEEENSPWHKPMLPAARPFVEALEVEAEVALDIVETAKAEVAQQLERARQIALQQDGPAWARLLHSLKGACSTLGALELSEYFQQREEELTAQLSQGQVPLELTKDLQVLEAYLSDLHRLATEIRALL